MRQLGRRQRFLDVLGGIQRAAHRGAGQHQHEFLAALARRSPARRAAFLTTWATACRQASPAAWPSASFTMPAPNGSVTDENTTGTCGAMPCAEFTACADGVALTCSTAGWARSS